MSNDNLSNEQFNSIGVFDRKTIGVSGRGSGLLVHRLLHENCRVERAVKALDHSKINDDLSCEQTAIQRQTTRCATQNSSLHAKSTVEI